MKGRDVLCQAYLTAEEVVQCSQLRLVGMLSISLFLLRYIYLPHILALTAVESISNSSVHCVESILIAACNSGPPGSPLLVSPYFFANLFCAPVWTIKSDVN